MTKMYAVSFALVSLIATSTAMAARPVVAEFEPVQLSELKSAAERPIVAEFEPAQTGQVGQSRVKTIDYNNLTKDQVAELSKKYAG